MAEVGAEASQALGKDEQAAQIIRHYSKWAAGAGAVPVPLLDLVAISGVQLRMLSKLADLYGVSYSGTLGKTLISALLGSLVPVSLRATTLSLIRATPLVGPLLGFLTLPAYSAATTYAIGTVFSEHFERGGQLETLDVEAAKQQTRALVDRAKEPAGTPKTAPPARAEAKPDTATAAEPKESVAKTTEPARPKAKAAAAKPPTPPGTARGTQATKKSAAKKATRKRGASKPTGS